MVCKYFLPVCGLSFHFAMVSFAVQNLLSLNGSYLFIFALSLLFWETDLRKHWYNLYQRMFCQYSLQGLQILLTVNPKVLFCIFELGVFLARAISSELATPNHFTSTKPDLSTQQ